MNKIKVGIMTTSMDGRMTKGTGVYTAKTVEYLIKNHSDELDLYLIHFPCLPEERSDLYDKAKEIIIPFRQWIPISPHFFSETLFFLFNRLDLDILHFPRPTLYPTFIFYPTKNVIVSMHDAGCKICKAAKSFANFVFNFTIRHFNSKIDGIVVNSHFSKWEIHRDYGFFPDKMFVNHYGLDKEHFKKLEIPKEKADEILKKYKIKRKFILDVSRLQPHKNVDRLLLAFEKLVRSGTADYQLVVVGGRQWDYRGTLNLVKKLNMGDKILLTSAVKHEDMPFLYNLAEMMVFPSLHEGFGIPVIEAQACGCPVITSNISSLPEIAGGGTILADPYSPDDICKAIKRFLEDRNLREELIQKGFENIKRFSWEKAADNLVKFYKRLLLKKKDGE